MYKGLAWKLIVVFVAVCCGLHPVAAQSCGSRDTTIVNPNNQLVRTLTITDYVNDDLADPQQGLCAVELDFVHQYVENLEITLTSPSGQMVQLIGPNSDDQFDFTLFTQWRVSFVPCSETAEPDPFFSPRWDNEQPMSWASGGRYSGSYYPYVGCLEDFNFGAVNGLWTLTVNNNPSANPGAITAVRLIFCDSRGVDCCLASGGRIRNEDILACTGADTLAISAQTSFPAGMADTTDYAYTYLLARNDVIIEWDSLGEFDLRGATAATYEICGLSYLQAQADSLPLPAIQPSLQALRDTLSSLRPPFCGELSENCQQVRVVAPPDTTFLRRRICAGDSVAVGDTYYRTSGRYWASLPGFAACDSVVQLDLEVEPTPTTLLQRTICAEDSLFFGGSYRRSSGLYRDTLATADLGCDSIVTLELEVLPPLSTALRPVLCAGDSLVVGDSTFQTPGIYTVWLTSQQGCDSLVTVDLRVLSPEIDISGQDTLDCLRTVTTLRRVSRQGGQVGSLRWTDASGTLLGTGEEIVVDTGGWYFLTFTQTLDGVSCSDRDSFLVTDLRLPVVADAGVPTTIDCRSAVVNLGGNSSVGPNFTYQWSVFPSVPLSGPLDEAVLQTNQVGRYQLIVTDTRSSCSDTSEVVVSLDTIPPTIQLGPALQLNCTRPLDTLTAGLATVAERRWNWTGPCIDEELPDAGIQVSCAGWYTFMVEDLTNGCTSRDSVRVTEDFTRPVAAIAPVDTLTCDRDSVVLTAVPASPGQPLSYRWTFPDGSIQTAVQLRSAQPGAHQLVLTNNLTGCRDTALVQVAIDTLAPLTGTLTPDTIDCRQPSTLLEAVGVSTGATIEYQWFEDGNLLVGATEPALTVTDAARYRLLVTNQRNGCRDSVQTTIRADFDQPPFFNLGPDQEMSCGQDFLALYPDSVSTQGLSLSWNGPCLLPAPDSQWARVVACPGTYWLTVSREDNGCASTDTVRVRPATDFVRAILPDSTLLSCIDGTGVISTAGSSAGQYRWTRNGIPISLIEQNPLIGGPGEYRLIIENSLQTCADTATTVAYFDCNLEARIAPPLTLTCDRQSVVLDATASTGDGPLTYEWLAPPACYLGELDSPTLEVLCAGAYQLVLTQTVAGLRDTATVVVDADNSVPQFNLPANVELSCAEPDMVLRPEFGGPTDDWVFRWTDLEENIMGTTDTLLVTQAGTYVLEVTDTQTGCSAVRFVTVTADSNLPTIAIGSDVFPCTQDTFLLQAFISPGGVDYTINWTGPAIRGAADEPVVTIEDTGTYTVTARNPDNGCTSTLSVEVVPQPCEPCIELAVPDTLTCDPGQIVLSATLCAPCVDCSLRWFREGNLIAGADSLQLPITEEGDYRVELIDSEGLMASESATVVRFPEITPFDFGPPLVLDCDSRQVTLRSPSPPLGNTWDYTWERVADNELLSTDSTLVVDAEGAYRLSVRDIRSGCVYAAVARVEEDLVPPTAEAGPDLALDCNTEIVIPDPAGSSLQGVSYSWQGPAGCVSGATALQAAFSCPGTYFLTVQRADNGCTATDSLVVSQLDDRPVVAPIPDTSLTCERTDLLLRGQLPADGGDYEPRWCQLTEAGVEMSFTCQFSTTYAINQAGLYEFTVTNRETGCSSSERVVVSVDTLPPVVEAGPRDTLLCDLTSLQLRGESPAGGEVSWSSSEGYSITGANSLTPEVTQAGWYTLTVRNPDNGCVGVDSVEVVADERRPVLTPLPDTLLNCAQPSLLLSATGATSSGSLQWEWARLDGEPLDNANTAALRVDRPGTYSLRLVDPANDCQVADTIQVSSDFRRPTAVIDALDSMAFDCRTDTLALVALNSTSASGAALTYQWSVQGSGNLFPDLGAPIIQSDQPGLYRLIVTDQRNGCRDSLPFQLRGDFVPPDFTWRAALPPLNCNRDSVVLAVDTDQPTTALDYLWQTPAGDTLSNGPEAITREPGFHRLTLTRLDNGCSSSDSIQVQADFNTPMVRIAQPGALSCRQSLVVLDGRQSQAGSQISYRWEAMNGGPLLGNATGRVDSVGTPGTYVLIVTDAANGCSSRDSVEVERIDDPITDLQVETSGPTCQSDFSGFISVEEVIGGTPPYTYQLLPGGPSLFSFFEDLPAGEYELVVVDAFGCDFRSEFSLLPPPELLLELGADRELLLGDTIVLSPQPSRPVVEYRWEARETLSGSSPVLRPQRSQLVSLTVVDELGCRASDTLFVTVLEDLPVYAPTAFAPTGSGQNTHFTLYGEGNIVAIRELQIFNRWGTLVFERQNFAPNQPLLGWDGRLDGQLLNSAVFVWLAEVELPDGQIVQLAGDVLLMR